MQALSSVTDNAGTGNIYTVQSAVWTTGVTNEVSLLYGVNLLGNPTTLTLNFAGTVGATFIRLDEYSGVDSVNAIANLAEVDIQNPSVSMTTTRDGCLIWELIYNGDNAQPTQPTGFNLRGNHYSSTGELSADIRQSLAGITAPAWATNGSGNQNMLAALAFAPSPLVSADFGSPIEAALVARSPERRRIIW
jgi:hypothetical protein